jgi:autotransporter passenger strand-loop-strand repeat protein
MSYSSTTNVLSGATSNGIVVSSGVQLVVSSGGVVSGITVLSGGYEHVLAGGTDSGTTVESGGLLDDFGYSYNTIITNGGTVGVGFTGQMYTATVESGGLQNVQNGGFAQQTTISGGLQAVSGGIVLSDSVSSGGIVNVTNFGQFEAGTVYTGGTVNLHSATFTGPPSSQTHVSAGGTLNAAPSVTLTNVIFASGATSGVLCFAAGAHIQSERGLVAVEDLAVGDVVSARFAGTAPIVWIGERTIDCRRHARPEGVWPVRVRAGAFGQGVPFRDVMLSPDHAVFVGEVLVPVRELVDGGMIVQERVDSVTYYHVELAQHDVLFADGLPAESYLDTGNRANFQGEAGVIALHPEFAALSWDALGCAPLVLAGPQLEAARRMVVRVDEPEWAQGIAATA